MAHDATAQSEPPPLSQLPLPGQAWGTEPAVPDAAAFSAMAHRMGRQCACGAVAHRECTAMYNQLVEHAPRFVPEDQLIRRSRWVGGLWVSRSTSLSASRGADLELLYRPRP